MNEKKHHTHTLSRFNFTQFIEHKWPVRQIKMCLTLNLVFHQALRFKGQVLLDTGPGCHSLTHLSRVLCGQVKRINYLVMAHAI